MSGAEAPRYRVLFELASGGMGVVYVAERRQGRFRRLCAMKRLRAGADEETKRMFLEEARVAGLLRHPNVVSVIDYGTDGEGPYLIMDLVDGVSLRGLIRAARQARTSLPLQHVASIGAAIAEGLSAAHELQDETGTRLDVVHRDVSPQNVLVGFDGSVRLTDFGIARAERREMETTQQGILKGKIAYMSPEQLGFRKVDQRSDLFALGVVLYELASGRKLYGGEDGPLRILEEPPPNLRLVREDVGADLRDLVSSLLAKDPADRPVGPRAVASRLHEIHAAHVVKEGRQSLAELMGDLVGDTRRTFQERIRSAEEALEETETPRWKKPWVAAVAVAAVLAVGAVAGALAATADPEPEAVTPVAAPPAEAARTRPAAEPVPLAEPPSEPGGESEAVGGEAANGAASASAANSGSPANSGSAANSETSLAGEAGANAGAESEAVEPTDPPARRTARRRRRSGSRMTAMENEWLVYPD